MLLRIGALNFSAILELEVGEINCRDRPDAGFAFAQRSPVLGNVRTEDGDHRQSRDDHATAQAGFFSATSDLTPSTISRTLLIWRAFSSEMLISNAPSSSNRMF